MNSSFIQKTIITFFRLIVFPALIVFPVIAKCENYGANSFETAGNKHVQAELVFDKENLQVSINENSVASQLGVLLKIEPGWHIYWKNPGEAGKPTQVEWNLPTGWKTDELQWPTPIKLIEKGNIKTYSYTNEVLLFNNLILPPLVPEKEEELDFGANISFLVCSDRCIPGKIHVSKKIKLTSFLADSFSVNQKIFDRYKKLTPLEIPLKELEKSLQMQISSSIASDGKVLLFKVAKFIKNINFFDYLDGAVITNSEIGEDHTYKYLKLTLDQEFNPDKSLSGELILEFNDQPRKAFILRNIEVQNSSKFAEDVDFSPNTFLTKSEDKLVEETVVKDATSGSPFDLLVAIVCSFIGGVILNFMPCVLPVLSIKIFGVINSKSNSKSQNIKEALYFSFGILSSFMVLAFVATFLKASGESIGWGFQFQYPGFVLSMIVILFLVALSFFDLITLNVPKFISNSSFQSHQTESPLFKNVIDGFLISALSTPCTAPFLGTALAFAFTQSYLVLFLIFISIGIGLSSPYFVVISSPSLLAIFPKPGTWLMTFKKFMAIGILGTMLWLISVLESILPNTSLKLFIWLFFFGILIWLIKMLLSIGNINNLKSLATLVCITLTTYGLFSFYPLKKSIEQRDNLDLIWEDFLSIDYREQDQVVFIDFTADWCITCKYNERFVLSSSSVKNAFKNAKVITLKADWTKGDQLITKALNEMGGEGVPHYVLVDKNKKNTVLPSILTEKVITDALHNLDK